MIELAIINANVVLPSEILIGGSLAIGEGVIQHVVDSSRALGPSLITVDARGCVPHPRSRGPAQRWSRNRDSTTAAC